MRETSITYKGVVGTWNRSGNEHKEKANSNRCVCRDHYRSFYG